MYACGRGRGHGHGITRGRGHGGKNSGRGPMQAPKKYTLRDIPKYTIDNQGYKTMHSQRERKQKMLKLNRPFRAVKKFTDEEEH